ncbi:tetratricopeptide repeat protein [Geofilum rubicundum]|uniref:FOG protein containing TPR repeat n=1 Tax=Geofilum rubicundum JCM 15548 TaxID=1236989 RepID=A0A0E9LTV9_9BACT|nr:tetratricopeptide repeat protein [Geofilum rubicundum]GAO28694.1 FOG protein containing TPR repeat [Geofilum rubicundum JCM 15548]
MHESWQTNYNDIKEEIERFELMESGEKTFYFDVHTIENIFDFYTDKFQFDKAERVLLIGIHQHPDATSLQAKQAILLMEKGDDPTAIRLMERLIRVEQSNPEMFLNLGLAYLRNNRVSESIQFFKRSLEQSFDEREEILLDIAVYLNQQDQYKQTISFLKPGCKAYPFNESLLFELAYAYDKEGNVVKGRETYEQLLSLNPFSENAWYNLGILFIKNEEYDNAIACYDYTLALNPEHAEALFNKANSLVSMGQPLEAIDYYIEYISFGYDPLLPYHYIADCYDQTGNHEMALRFYRLTVKADFMYMPAWLNYLAHLINHSLVDEALIASDEALKHFSEVGEIWYLRARVLLLNGDFNGALPALQFCFEEDPDSLRNIYELYQVQKTVSPRKKSERMIKNWVKSYPDSPAVHYLATSFYLLEERDLNQAAYHLEIALSENADEYDFFIDLFPKIEKMIIKSKKLSTILDNNPPYEF